MQTDTFTAPTARLVALAEKAGLRPETRPAARGAIRVVLNGQGPDAGCGDITVGARTGRVLRMRLWRGNRELDRPAREVTTTGYVQSLVALQEYATYARVVLGVDHTPIQADEALNDLRDRLAWDRVLDFQPRVIDHEETSGSALWDVRGAA
jgi:hypothetical protein